MHTAINNTLPLLVVSDPSGQLFVRDVATLPGSDITILALTQTVNLLSEKLDALQVKINEMEKLMAMK